MDSFVDSFDCYKNENSRGAEDRPIKVSVLGN